MSTFAEKLAEDRRGVVLRALDEVSDYRLSEDSLRRILAHFAHTVGGDVLRQDLLWLEEHRLVRVERLGIAGGGELWVATLHGLGQEVAKGRAHVGVARQAPR